MAGEFAVRRQATRRRRRRAKAQRWLCGESDSRRQFASEVGYLGFPSSTKIRGRRIFFRQSRRREKFPGPRIALQNACQKENERISTMPFLLWHFSLGDKTENRPAQFLAVCWIAHVDFKVHRLRAGFSVSNALLLSQSLPASSAMISM